MIPPLDLPLVRPYLKCCVQFWSSQYKRDTGKMKRVQQRGTRMMKGLDHLSCEKSLRELVLFSLEKRSLREILSVCINT